MKNILMLIVGGVFFLGACSDPELDPFQLDKITKGNLIALRGDAVDILNNAAYLGACDTFSLAAGAGAASFDFEADYLSDEPSNLTKVEVFAKATDKGDRRSVLVKQGSEFAIPSGGKYPRASFSVPLSNILSAIGKNIGDYTEGQYIYFEADLTLNDGTVIAASSFTNLSLSESAYFFPAHNLRMIATK